MSNEIVPYADMQRMAVSIARSGLFGVRTPDQALALMLVSQAEGRHPALAARDYDVIQGRPSKKAEAMARDFLQAGGKIKWHTLSDTVAEAEFSHPNGGSVTIKWDLAQANRAGLGGKDMWKKYPRQMLRARCVSEGVRTVFPAATSGMYVPEEVRDFGPADTGNGTTIDAVADTADVLDEFAATGDTLPPREYDILGDARAASLRGVQAFRDFWVALSQPERDSIKSHLAEFETAAKQADDPFGLPPTQADLLNTPPEETSR
jgi:hypothetical protein